MSKLLIAMALGAVTPAPGAETPSQLPQSRPGKEIRGAFFALSVKDARTIAQWYRTNLGFRTLVERDLPDRGIVAVLLEREDSQIEIIQRAGTNAAPTDTEGKRSSIEIQGPFKIGLTVADLQGLHDHLAAAGAKFDYHIVQPDGNPWRTFAVRDPEDNIVQFFGK